jgi:transcription factor STE12
LLNDDDLENEDNESISNDEEDSPSESIHHSVNGVSVVTSMPSSIALQPSMGSMMAPHMIAPQLLQQHI